MAGTCSAIINVCVQNWQCEPRQTGFEVDGCGTRRANPACNPRPPYQLGDPVYWSDHPGIIFTVIGISGGLYSISSSQSIGYNVPESKLSYAR